MSRAAFRLFFFFLQLSRLMVHGVSTECDSATIEQHDIHCTYTSSISASSSDYTDKWQITYPSLKEQSSSLFSQFVHIKIVTSLDTSLLITPLIRSSCAYSFQDTVSFKSSSNEQTTYTVILPSCNEQSVELCTYYIVIEASNHLLESNANNVTIQQAAAQYEMSASLGVMLRFQQKYSYSPTTTLPSNDDPSTADDSSDGIVYQDDGSSTKTKTEDDDGSSVYVYPTIMMHKLSAEDDNDAVNATCIAYQLYGVKASTSDFPIGIIMQPEFLDRDAGFTVSKYTSAPNTQVTMKDVNKLRGGGESDSYNIPSVGYISSEDLILLNVLFYETSTPIQHTIQAKYTIYSQPNISYLQVSVINSGGWFLVLILVLLIIIAMCRKHCCLRHSNHNLSYNDFLESIQATNPLFFNDLNNPQHASSNADDPTTQGVPLDKLDKVSQIETYRKPKKLRNKGFNPFKLKKKLKHDVKRYRYKACCICLYDYKNNDRIRKLKCSHYFHQTCVDRWFAKNVQCPLCKQYVISAKSLCKMSSANSSGSKGSSSSSATSGSKSSLASSGSSESCSESTSTLSAFRVDECEDEKDEEELVCDFGLMDEERKESDVGRREQRYSLSDSHCGSVGGKVYQGRSEAVSDDMGSIVSKHSHTSIRHRHTKSGSGNVSGLSRSQSSGGCVGGTPPLSVKSVHVATNTNTSAATGTLATVSSKEISLSMEAHGVMGEGVGCVPLSPSGHLYFESTFGTQSPSAGHKHD